MRWGKYLGHNDSQGGGKAGKAISSMSFSINLDGFPSYLTPSLSLSPFLSQSLSHAHAHARTKALNREKQSFCALKMRGSYMGKVVQRKLSLTFCRGGRLTVFGQPSRAGPSLPRRPATVCLAFSELTFLLVHIYPLQKLS